MKILFDQNISFRILKLLPPDYQASKQVRSVGLEGATDQEIWRYAKENGFAIATFDADFADIAYLRGFPPKVIWLRTGNKSTNEIAQLMKKIKVYYQVSLSRMNTKISPVWNWNEIAYNELIYTI